jgi:hypothetical protein
MAGIGTTLDIHNFCLLVRNVLEPVIPGLGPDRQATTLLRHTLIYLSVCERTLNQPVVNVCFKRRKRHLICLCIRLVVGCIIYQCANIT